MVVRQPSDFSTAPKFVRFAGPGQHLSILSTAGVRFAFAGPDAPPAPATPQPVPLEREFIVFFGHNKSNLTAEAQEVIRQRLATGKVALANFITTLRGGQLLRVQMVPVLAAGRQVLLLVPEINLGQLRTVVRSEFLVDAVGFNLVRGKPFGIGEIEAKAEQLLGDL